VEIEVQSHRPGHGEPLTFSHLVHHLPLKADRRPRAATALARGFAVNGESKGSVLPDQPDRHPEILGHGPVA